MQTIDMTKETGYTIIQFPDGEKHLKLNEVDRKEPVRIICRIRNGEELFLIMQLSDILKREEVEVEEIRILYLMGSRMDRVISFNESFSLKIVSEVVNSLNARHVYVFEPHSNRLLRLIKNSNNWYYPIGCFEEIICFPDHGAAARYNLDEIKRPYILCSKTRNPENGRLVDFKIEDSSMYTVGNITVIDDLCDGGGTFIGIAPLLRELKPSSLNIKIAHAVQKAGIEKISKMYDNVLITNSYNDWQYEDLPDNVKVDIINP